MILGAIGKLPILLITFVIVGIPFFLVCRLLWRLGNKRR